MFPTMAYVGRYLEANYQIVYMSWGSDRNADEKLMAIVWPRQFFCIFFLRYLPVPVRFASGSAWRNWLSRRAVFLAAGFCVDVCVFSNSLWESCGQIRKHRQGGWKREWNWSECSADLAGCEMWAVISVNMACNCRFIFGCGLVYEVIVANCAWEAFASGFVKQTDRLLRSTKWVTTIIDWYYLFMSVSYGKCLTGVVYLYYSFQWHVSLWEGGRQFCLRFL